MILRLRPATYEDWAKLFSWRNDAETRARFTSKQIVSLQDHLAWLRLSLEMPAQRRLLIAEDPAGRAVGTTRLDIAKTRRRGQWAECSITIEPRLRSHGYGRALVGALVAYATCWPLAGVIAKVMPDNFASLRAFAACGFRPTAVTEAIVTLERGLCQRQDAVQHV
jgi:RimJ/RimL family protein N-acetyltransferase